MFIRTKYQKILLAASLFLFMSASLNAEPINVDPAQIFNSTSSDEYRQELLRLQNSDNVCNIRLGMLHKIVFTGTKAVERLTPNMLAVIYKMQRQLENDLSFRHHIGGLIERDLEDLLSEFVIPTEIGGLGLYVDNSIELLPIPNKGRLELSAYINERGLSVSVPANNNNNYMLPDWARESIPHILEFHIHATSPALDGERNCSPSFGTDGINYTGDIGYAGYIIRKHSFTHEFVFTNLGDRKYSVVYFGGQKVEGSHFVSVIALPNIQY